MSYIHPYSREATKSELDLFVVPSTQVAIIRQYEQEYKPISNYENSQFIEFRIPGMEDYIDLNTIYMCLEARILKADNTELPNAAGTAASPNEYNNILPIRYLLNSLWEQVDYSLNSVCVSTAQNTYPYRSFLDAHFYLGETAKKSWAQAAGIIPVTERKKFANGSKTFQLVGQLHGDILQQGRLLLSFVDLNIRFIRSRPEFLFTRSPGSPDTHVKMVISNMSLFVTKKSLNPEHSVSISRSLLTATAKYFITRTEVKTLVVPANQTLWSSDILFSGHLPRDFLFGLVKSSAFNGSYAQDPFKFDNFNLCRINILDEGRYKPSTPYSPNFADDIYAREYYSLYKEMKQNNPHPCLGISAEVFKTELCLFSFDLSPGNDELTSDEVLSPQREGNVRLELLFKEATAEALTIIVYSHFDNLIEINSDRNVTKDY